MISEQLAQIRTDIENTPVSGATPEQIYACVKGGLLLLDAYKVTQQWVHDLQAGMYINCVYCGHRYGPDDEVPATMADTLKEHVEQCPEHPMSALKRELDVVLKREKELADALRALMATLADWRHGCIVPDPVILNEQEEQAQKALRNYDKAKKLTTEGEFKEVYNGD